MDRCEQRSKKRTGVTKEQALNFLCANDAAEQDRGVPRRREKTMGSRSPVGPRRLGAATRISASLSRRLSAFFESTSRPRSQSGKVRRSDTRPGDVGERAERSEGSDTTPHPKRPVFRRMCPCVRFFERSRVCVYPLSLVKANVGHLCEKLKSGMKSGWGSVVTVTFWRYLRKRF